MPNEVKQEPTVSVHGVPKSQYEAGAVPSGGGGGDSKKWILWIGLGVVGLIVIFMFFGGGGQQTTDTTGGSGGTSSDNANMDAEMQKLQSEIDQILANQNKTPTPQPKPPKPPKKRDPDSGIPITPDALHHVTDLHGFLPHQRLG